MVGIHPGLGDDAHSRAFAQAGMKQGVLVGIRVDLGDDAARAMAFAWAGTNLGGSG